MGYVIFGAGAVGGLVGARLHGAGYPVTLVARGAHAEKMQAGGLTLRTPEAVEHHDVSVVQSVASAPLDDETIVILAVKSQDTAAALDALRAATASGRGGPAIVCAQNGVANEVMAARLFDRVYGAMVWTPATHLVPGEVSVYAAPIGALLEIGRYGAGVDETVERVVADLSASQLAARPCADIMARKRGKLLTNVGNAVEALCGPTELTRPLRRSLRAEGEAVFAAAGLSYVPVRALVESCADAISEIDSIDGEARPGGSSWQSLGRKTGGIEADYLNGEIAALGLQLGVATPFNRRVQRAAVAAARAGTAPGTLDPRVLMVANSE